jgi:hypothetical protein
MNSQSQEGARADEQKQISLDFFLSGYIHSAQPNDANNECNMGEKTQPRDEMFLEDDEILGRQSYGIAG